MSAYSDSAAQRDADLLAQFGETVTFTPQDGSGPQSIQAIPVQPGMPEEVPAGFGKGTVNLRLWLNIKTVTPTPQKGDSVTYAGKTYTLGEVDPDVDGGATFHLIRN